MQITKIYYDKMAEFLPFSPFYTVFLPFRSVLAAFSVGLRYNNGMYNATTPEKISKTTS